MTMVPAEEVRVGDRVRGADGSELTVTRIDHGLLGMDEYIAFVEDSDEQWLKLTGRRGGEIDVVARGD